MTRTVIFTCLLSLKEPKLSNNLRFCQLKTHRHLINLWNWSEILAAEQRSISLTTEFSQDSVTKYFCLLPVGLETVSMLWNMPNTASWGLKCNAVALPSEVSTFYRTAQWLDIGCGTLPLSMFIYISSKNYSICPSLQADWNLGLAVPDKWACSCSFVGPGKCERPSLEYRKVHLSWSSQNSIIRFFCKTKQ